MTLKKKRRKKSKTISRQQDEYDTSILVKTHNSIINFAVASLLLLSCLPLTGSIWLIINGHLTQSWPSTKGKIISSDLVTVSSYIVEPTYSGRYPRERKIYEHQVVYTYSVNKKFFSGTRLSYGGVEMTQNVWLEKDGPPKEVTVYYSPTNPEKSVLQPGISEDAYYLLYFGVLCVIVSMIIFCFRKKKQLSSAIIQEVSSNQKSSGCGPGLR